MIQSLEINNFQSHKNSKLEFHLGVNTIIGESDTGKSAIIRALRWLIWNRPQGESFMSDKKGETEVILTLDGTEIIRRKNKTENLYILNNSKFEAFGTSVPEEITKALNLNEINLQQQLDSHFLLSKSPGEVALHFNQIAHLDQIDTGQRNIDKWIKEIKQNIASGNKTIEQQEENLKKFEYLEKFEIVLEVLEEQEKQLITKINSARNLRQLITSIEEITAQIEQDSVIIQLENEVNNILSLIDKKREKVTSWQGLKKLINDITFIENQIEKEEIRILSLQRRFEKEMPAVCPLCGTKLKNK